MADKDLEDIVKVLPDGCWLPAKSKVVKVGGRRTSLRRYAWAVQRGAAPEGMDVRPACGRRMCVRPSHCRLEPSARAKRLSVTPAASTGSSGPVMVGEELVPARLYRAIREHPAASLAALRTKFGLSSSTIYKIRAGLVEEAA